MTPRTRTAITLPLLALLLAACAGCEQVTRVTDLITGRTPIRAAQSMEDPDYPDSRREGIANLVKRDFAREEPYTTRYRQVARMDEDHLVRAAAVRAMNVSRDQSDEAKDIYLAALDDESARVRLEGAKALFNMPDERAAAPLTRLLRNDPDKDVRIAAAAALKYYKNLDVARALIGVLDDRDFGVSWQARRSLRRLTGQDLAYDEAAWLALISGPENPLG